MNKARQYQLMPKEIFSKKIGWLTTELSARCYSMISHGRRERQWQLPLSTRPIVAIG
jgi:hypothetical protein